MTKFYSIFPVKYEKKQVQWGISSGTSLNAHLQNRMRSTVKEEKLFHFENKAKIELHQNNQKHITQRSFIEKSKINQIKQI
jgi:hypothetical protein